MTVTVLFICLGNICRSPMAEARMRALVEEAGLADQIGIDSAGTGAWHIGDRPHRGTQAVLARHGISSDGMLARQVHAADLAHFDYLVVMDAGNEREVLQMADQHGAKGQILRLLDFADPVITNGERDVPDPYYSGGFEHIYTLVDSATRGLLDHIQTEHLLY